MVIQQGKYGSLIRTAKLVHMLLYFPILSHLMYCKSINLFLIWFFGLKNTRPNLFDLVLIFHKTQPNRTELHPYIYVNTYIDNHTYKVFVACDWALRIWSY